MRPRLSLVFCFVVVGICSAATTYIAYLTEKTDLQWRADRLNQQIGAEFSQNVRLAALLAKHRDIQSELAADRPKPRISGALNRLVLETSRVAILVADPSGQISAWGHRDPASPSPIATIPDEVRQRLSANQLSRRFVHKHALGWMFETARPVLDADRNLLGFVFSYQSLEDMAQYWRALPDGLVLQNMSGDVLYSHTRFAPPLVKGLEVTLSSPQHGIQLTLARDPGVLLPRAGLGALVGLCLALVVIFALSIMAKRREVTLARVNALAEGAAILERRVAERTQELVHEIQGHQRTETALRASQEQLVQTAKLKVLNDLASGLSHELSQPLCALEASLDTLAVSLDGQAGAPLDRLDKAQRVTRRMGQILSNLKGFARKDDTPPHRINLRNPIEAALDILDHEIKRKRVQVELDLPETDVFGIASEVRLQQVIVNLISNSLDAMEDDGTGLLRISVKQRPNRISVSDNGGGIADPDAALTPFYTTKADQNGLGLGLSISRDIMQSFGGNLEITPGLENGAEITLEFDQGREEHTG